MRRFLIAFAIGVVLTIGAMVAAGLGHGPNAPLVFTSPLIVCLPGELLPAGFVTGPFIWGGIFSVYPNVQKTRGPIQRFGNLAGKSLNCRHVRGG